MHRVRVSTLSLIAVLTACIGAFTACGRDSRPAVTVTDSAGVRITLSPDSPKTFAEVDPQPVGSIGGADDTGPSQFFQVQGVHLDPRGRLWVTDGQSGELRIFHADGSHWKTRGGRGEGPGEFLRLRSLGPFRGDSVGLADNARGVRRGGQKGRPSLSAGSSGAAGSPACVLPTHRRLRWQRMGPNLLSGLSRTQHVGRVPLGSSVVGAGRDSGRLSCDECHDGPSCWSVA
jgi:hypothetical protein